MKKQIIEEKEKITVELTNKIVVLTLESFSTDIDMDEMLKIHHHNLYAEIITVSVALNRIGNLLASMSEILAEGKLDMEIFEAQKKEEVRKQLATIIDEKSGKVYKATVDEIDATIVRKPEYKVKKKHLITLQKNWDIISSYYWAMQSKSEKLNKLTEKLRPDDMESELIEEKINGVMIKTLNKTIK